MASAGGSHGGSFAGGFIKSFLAVMQMSMRKRQLDDMHQFYDVMRQQMILNMKETQGRIDTQNRMRGGAWGGKSFEESPLGTGDTKLGNWWTSDRIQHATDRLVNEAGLSKEGAAGLVARWAGVEAPGGPGSSNDEGGGHWGIGQWDKDRGGPSMKDASFDEQLTHAIGELNGKESDAAAVLRNAKTPEEGARGASMYERAEDYNQKTGTDRYTAKTPAAAVYNTVYGKEPTTAPIPSKTSAIQSFKSYRVAGPPQPPPASSIVSSPAPTLPPDQFQTGGPELAAATAPVPPASAPTSTPALGGGPGNVLEVPTGTPAPVAQPAAISSRDAAPGTVQYNVGGVRGQQPGAGGPIYTAGQVGQPASTLPTTTGQNALLERPIPSRNLQRPQQVPLSQTPMPPPRPADFGGVDTDTSGNVVPVAQQDMMKAVGSGGQTGGTGDPLWAGYQGASPDQAASADPLQNLYSSGENFSASAGLTDTSGLMAAGEMPDIATAEMYKGGPVIRYQRGGVIRRYASGGDTDDMLSEYGGTDTDDPMASAYWDQQRVANLTNNSEQGAIPDLPTSIQNRAALSPQEEQQLQPPPAPDTSLAPSAAPTEPAPTGQAPTDEQAPTEQPSSQSDIPPGSVQVAGPGGWGSVGTQRELTNIPLPRVGGSMGMGGGMRMPRPSMSSVMRGGRTANTGRLGNQPLYTPEGFGDNDYNHMGLAPVSNPDGGPSVWLLNMVDNGVRALFSGFQLANRGAMPGSPDEAQNLQTFGTHPGVDKKDMSDLGDMIDPKHQLYEGGRDIAGAVGMIKYYAITGQLDAASRLAGGVLLYSRMMSMQYGDEAVKSLFNGDYKNAVKSLEKGYNWIPDAKTAEVKGIDEKTGKVSAVQKDGNGNVIDQQDYLPAAIMKAALGLKDGTGYWNMLGSLARAGGNDPMGSHYETQRMLRQIQGNEHVPPPPLATLGEPKTTTPIEGATPPAPDGAQPPNGTQVPDSGPTPVVAPPDGAQAPAPSDGSVQAPPAAPAIPSAGDNTIGQATPAQPAPGGVIPARGDTSNLVAGPGAPSTAQPQPAPQGGSGAVLVAQEQARADQAQQSQAIQRMIHTGMYDPDDPYMQQKIAQIDKQYIDPLRQYRTQLEQQYADIEGADISPADKKALQTALVAKLKNFDETSFKPAINEAKMRVNAINARLKEQFGLQKSIALQKQAAINKQQEQAGAYDNQRVAAEQKRQAMLPPGHPQVNANDGLESDGSPLVNKATNEHILGYSELLEKPFAEKNATTDNYANPIVRYAKLGNPYLSSSYDGKNNGTFDPTKLFEYKPTDLKTMSMASRDMIMSNSGNITFRDAQDLTTGVSTGAYSIQRVPHPKIHSMVLGDLDNDDKIPRTDVIIGRGIGDPNPMRVVMTTDNANRLVDLAQRVDHTSKFNKSMVDANALPDDKTIHGPEPAIAPEPIPPRSASNSPIALPPRSEQAPGENEMKEYLRLHPPTGPISIIPRREHPTPPSNPWDQPIQFQ